LKDHRNPLRASVALSARAPRYDPRPDGAERRRVQREAVLGKIGESIERRLLIARTGKGAGDMPSSVSSNE
jgi:hypothetical protein